MNCPRCEGTGRCADCKGTGSIVCPNCEGTGSKTSRTGTVFECRSCGGKGTLECPTACASCEGTGEITEKLQQKVREKYSVKWDNTSPISRMCTALFISNIIFFALQQIPETRGTLHQWFLNTGDGWTSGQIWRLVTPIFLHGGMWHIAMNSAYLMYVGPLLEGFMGSRRFLAFYLFTGIVGNIFSWIGQCQIEHSAVAGIGASTSLFGLTGAIIALHQRWGYFDRQQVVNRGLLAIGYMLYGFAGGLQHIDHWGHLGGFLGGFVYVFVTRRPAGR